MTVDLDFEQFKSDVAGLLQITNTDLYYDSDILSDIGIDSLRLVSLGVKLQDIYSIKISTAAFIELDTLGELYEYITKCIEAK